MSIVIAGLIMVGMAAILSLLVSRRISQPLEKMTEGAERFAQGDLGHRLPLPGSLEMKRLAESMNEMAAHLGQEFDTIHLGTCVVKARKTGSCPLDLDRLPEMIRENFGKEVVVGTHLY